MDGCAFLAIHNSFKVFYCTDFVYFKININKIILEIAMKSSTPRRIIRSSLVISFLLINLFFKFNNYESLRKIIVEASKINRSELSKYIINEYEKKIKEQEKRLIHITVSAQRKFLIIRVENYYEGTLQYEENLPITTKKQAERSSACFNRSMAARPCGVRGRAPHFFFFFLSFFSYTNLLTLKIVL